MTFGDRVSIDGDTMVIGAYKDDDDGSDSGSAYVFTRDTVQLDAGCQATDGADRFGGSVSIDGDTMVIGAYKDDDKGSDSGSAYVFTRNTPGDFASNWTRLPS